MRTICKYELAPYPEPTVLDLPKGSEPIHVGVQNHVIYVWVEIANELSTKRCNCVFHVVDTGSQIRSSWNYIGTVFQGPFVRHIYYDYD